MSNKANNDRDYSNGEMSFIGGPTRLAFIAKRSKSLPLVFDPKRRPG